MSVSSVESAPRYRIVRRLGQGGMAEVFEAELVGAHGFARRVAIKRMAEHIAHDPGATARFLEEARIASSLHHAGIVAVLDFGVMDGIPFQVLELVDGLNADQLMDRASDRATGVALPTDIALAIAADVAHALHHAHEAHQSSERGGGALGIVHRDVKPSNVLISWSGDIKLSDFGIAFAHGRAIQTETGLTPGSWAFMAPEQRNRSAIDRRADVFALGCTLHALLTGESPQRDFEVAIALAAGQPLDLTSKPGAAAFDDDVRALLARALGPRPADRFATAGELASAIGAALARRLSRDPRSRMQEFLAPLRAAPPPRAGLLDQLLAVELVLASEHGAVRQFELRPPETAAPAGPGGVRLMGPTSPLGRSGTTLPMAAPPPIDDPIGSPAKPLAASTSAPPRRRVALAGAAALASALIGWQVVSRSGGAAPAAPELAAISADAAPQPLASAVRAPDAAVEIADAGVGAGLDAAPATAPPASSAKRPRRDPHDKPAPTAPTAPVRQPPASPIAEADEADAPRGYLKVVPRDRRDPRMVNARVYIDGKLRGYSPDPISTTVGPHKVRVVLEDDTTELGTYPLEVKADHRDRGHPATLLVP